MKLGISGWGKKPATSILPSPNRAINSIDGMCTVPTPGSSLGSCRRSAPDLEGSRNCPLGASVAIEKPRGDWVGATGEKPPARLNGVLIGAVGTGLPINSGVSCCGDPTPPAEREMDAFFLRAGRIQGGRPELTVSSWGMVWLSSGICVTTSAIRSGEVVSTGTHTSAELFHHIARALTT